MTFSTKRNIDRICGSFLLCGLLPIYFLVKLSELLIRSGADAGVKTITISKFLGMGSILLAAPLLKKLRRLYPDAKITFLSFHDNRTILEQMDGVDTIETLFSGNILRMFWSIMHYVIRAPKPDVFIDLEFFSHFSLIIQLLSFARYRIGFWERRYFFRSLYLSHRIRYNPHKHITEMFHNVIYELEPRLAFQDPDIDLNLPKLHYSMACLASIRNKLRLYGLGRFRVIVINPHASDLSYLRRWPSENFQRLIEQLLKYPDHLVIIIGGPSDNEYNDVVVQPFRGRERFVDLCGMLSLKELIALLSNTDLFITNDSGPMHIANAQGTSTFALFGPESPVLYGPIGAQPRCTVFYKHAFCSPCMNALRDKVTDCQLNRCLMEIGVDEVMSSVQKWREQDRVVAARNAA